jgi:glycosyltransferase involved in cell wall biosynthesis
MTERPLTVCYFGAYKPNYPRNLFYRQALTGLGVQVVECRTATRYSTLRRSADLLRQFWRGAHRADVLMVAEFNHTLVGLAWVLARLHRMVLLFDPGLSFYDWHVLLTKELGPHAPRAIYLKLMETLAYRLPDLVLWFTPVDEEFFRDLFGIPASRSDWLPPGIDSALFYPTALPEQREPFIVHWDGNMAPMHGVDVILHAARLLAGEAAIRFELFGDGLVLPAMRELAASLELHNLQFFGFVTPQALRASVHRAHVCLGVFRGDDKLRRSLYTKEMQAMRSGRPLVTGFGEAKARVFKNGEDLIMIEPENPQALAEAILALARDPARALRLAQNGALAVTALCDPQQAGRKLLSLMQARLDRRRGAP